MDKPNILLLVIDCLRADFVCQKGLARIPTLDALRESGFCFDNAITSSTTTTPSFASLLTGQYPFQHGVRCHGGYRLNDAVITLPQQLAEAGYHTYAEVTGPLGPEIGLDRGFRVYRYRPRSHVKDGAWGSEFLERFPRDYHEPWFILLHLWSLHKNREILPECSSRSFGRTEYGRALSSLDVYLGRLVERLPTNTLIVITGDHGEDISYGALDKLYRKTRKKIFRYMQRHGWTDKHMSVALKGCYEGHSHSLYDSLVTVPLIFCRKGFISSGRSELQIRQVDICPTILDLVGLPPQEGLAGRTLRPIMVGQSGGHRDAYLEAVGVTVPDKYQWLTGMRVANRYKYIYAPFRQNFEPELYDLQLDPGEWKNIAEDRVHIAHELRQKIESLRAEKMVGGTLSEEEQETVMNRLKHLGYLD